MLGTIHINLYKTSGVLRKACIRRHALIKSLDQLFDNKNMTYLYQGSILNKESEAQAEGICSNCLIVALEPNETFKIPFWLIQSTKKETVTEEMLLLSNPNNKLEISRLRDLRMMKREFKMNFSKTTISTFSFPSDSENISINNSSLNLSYEPLTEPNTQELPVFW